MTAGPPPKTRSRTGLASSAGPCPGEAGKMMGESWMERAVCRTVPPELFFAPEGERSDSAQGRARVGVAKAVCRRCPVRPDCLAHAEKFPEHVGIWGGVDQERPLSGRRAARSDGRDEVTISHLISGHNIPGAAVVDRAHAVVRLHAAGGATKAELARRFGLTESAVTTLLRHTTPQGRVGAAWLRHQMAKEVPVGHEVAS